MTTPTPLPFTIETDGHGRTNRLVIDGQDVSDMAYAATFRAEAGQAPTLTVDLRPRAGRIDAVGYVEVVPSVDDIELARQVAATVAAHLNALATDLRSFADTPEFHEQVQASLTSMGADPIAATANQVAAMLDQMAAQVVTPDGAP